MNLLREVEELLLSDFKLCLPLTKIGQFTKGLEALSHCTSGKWASLTVELEPPAGLRFAVCSDDPDAEILAALELDPCFLRDKSSISSFVDLPSMLQVLNSTTLSISNLDSILKFDTTPAAGKTTSVDMVAEAPIMRKFPGYIERVCDAEIFTKALSEIIPFMVGLDGVPEKVTVEITERNVKLSIPNKELEYEQMEGEITGVTPGKKHRATLSFRHLDCLSKACNFEEDWFHLTFTAIPEKTIMLSFNITGLGRLIFLKKADTMECVAQ